MAEPSTLARPLHQARDVGHDEPIGVAPGHAQVRRERRERVIRDLRLGGGQTRQQGGLPRVGEPHEPDVGHRPELDVQGLLLAPLPRLGRARHPVARPGERHVAAPAPAATRHDRTRAVADQIGHQAVLVEHHRALGYGDHQLLARGAVPLRAPPRPAVPRTLVWMIGQPRQIVQPALDLEDHAPAVAPVAAVRSTPRLVGLGMQVRGAVPAVAGAHEHRALIDEGHVRQLRWSAGPRTGDDDAMTELQPVTVWLVRLQRGEVDKDVKGSLRIEGDQLIFTPADDAGTYAFPFVELSRAKRLRASPVMLVEHRRDGDRREIAFYFTQPPPLEAPGPQRAAGARRSASGASWSFRRLPTIEQAPAHAPQRPLPADHGDQQEGADTGCGRTR